MIKKSLLLGFAFLLIAGISYLEWVNQKPMKYVFINQTSDHRFDESIEVSIYSATLRTGVQNAVVILPALPAKVDLLTLSSQIFEKLDLGRKTQGRALLYVFVPTQKLLRIEVGYALEGVLPDIYVRGLEEAAKTFAYSDKYQDFWAELINTLNIKIAQGGTTTNPPFNPEDEKYISGGAGTLNIDFDTSPSALENDMRKLGKDDSLQQPLKSASAAVQQYLNTLALGVGDPRLPILSQGSQIFRLQTPMTIAQLKRNAEMYQKAFPFQIIESGGLALAVFKEGNPVLPIVLIKDKDQNWLIDEPKSWAYFHRFENSMEVFVKFPGHPFAGQLSETQGVRKDFTIYHGAAPAQNFLTTDVDFWPTFKKLAQQLQSQPTAENYFALGDFYFFEIYDLDRAKANYDKGLALAPEHFDYLWRMQDLEVNLGLNSERLKNLRRLAEHFPKDRELQRSNSYYQKALAFPADDWIHELTP